MTTVYRLDTPGDESEPTIRSDDPLNQNIDWRYLGSVLEGDNVPDLERLAEVNVARRSGAALRVLEVRQRHPSLRPSRQRPQAGVRPGRRVHPDIGER